jgi:hypothetical protein
MSPSGHARTYLASSAPVMILIKDALELWNSFLFHLKEHKKHKISKKNCLFYKFFISFLYFVNNFILFVCIFMQYFQSFIYINISLFSICYSV